MTAPPGTVQNDELWLRCPECGDSSHNPNKAHFSVNLKNGNYHCLRCKASGRLSDRQYLSVLTMVGETTFTLETTEEQLPLILPGPGNSRFSALERGHVTVLKDFPPVTWDAFAMRDPVDSTITGVHLRRPGKSKSLGDRGFGWVGESFPLSSPKRPLRLVEGPYDVLSAQDVAVFGTITDSELLELKGHSLILCPDGDIWTNTRLQYQFLRMLERTLNHRRLYPLIVMVEYLVDGKDPDEIPPEDRDCFRPPEYLRLIRSVIPRKKYQFELW